jgi:hypothetical protein
MASRARSIRRLVSSVARLIDPESDHIDHADVHQHERLPDPADQLAITVPPITVVFVVEETRDQHARPAWHSTATVRPTPIRWAAIRGGRQLASR